jgi:hypothetical protein
LSRLTSQPRNHEGNRITLVAGVPCASYDEFRFRRVDATWEVTGVERNDVVMCDEIRRRDD